MKLKASLVLLFILIIKQGYTQNKFSKWNFEYQYNPSAPIRCQHIVQDLNDTLVVYFKLIFDPVFASEKKVNKTYNWNFDYRFTNTYDTKKTITEGQITSRRFQISDTEFLFYFNVAKPKTAGSLYLFLNYFTDEKNKIYIHDIPLKIIEKEFYYDNILFEANGIVPVFDKYIHKYDTLMIKSSYNTDKISVYYFKYNYPPALPPHIERNSSDGDVRLKPDSVILTNPENFFVLNKKGICYIPSVVNNKGYSLLIYENKYPKVTRTKELIDPIVYISTNDETRSMKASAKPKIKLDEFWLNKANEKESARKLIKSYYSQVQYANLYFTDYKEGWRTDRGIIYTIFGKPDEVFKDDFKETWKYKKNKDRPSITFNFTLKTDSFGNYFYQLLNSEEYTNVWYNQVEKWRSGIVD